MSIGDVPRTLSFSGQWITRKAWPTPLRLVHSEPTNSETERDLFERSILLFSNYPTSHQRVPWESKVEHRGRRMEICPSKSKNVSARAAPCGFTLKKTQNHEGRAKASVMQRACIRAYIRARREVECGNEHKQSGHW